MKTKNIVAFLIVTTLLASCTPPATATPPTKTSSPSATSTVPVPSATPAPTKVPVTPTETQLSSADFLAKSENSFPLPAGSDLGYFFCIGDFDNITYFLFTAPDGTELRAWLYCEDGGVTFLVPLFVENKEMSYVTMAGAVVPYNGQKIHNDDRAVKARVEKLAKGLGLSGKARVSVLIGLNSGQILMFNDPYPSIFSSTGWDKVLAEFMASGDYNVLDSISGVSGRILPGVRVAPPLQPAP